MAKKKVHVDRDAEIVRRHSEGESIVSLAREFHLTKQRIDQITKGQKFAARRLAAAALASGQIERAQECAACRRFRVRLFMHHPNHKNPLDIVWLCGRCHARAEHRLKRTTRSKTSCAGLISARTRAGFSIEEVARRSDIPTCRIAQIERNSTRPTLREGINIAAAFGVSVEDVCSWFKWAKNRSRAGRGYRTLISDDRRRVWLSALRNNARISRPELARRVGCSVASISFWESGLSTPNPKNLQRLAEVFAISPDDLGVAFRINALDLQKAA